MAIITVKNKNFNQLPSYGHVLEDHAKAISDVCQKLNLIITLRNTGTHSLAKIKEGNPCKGHDILEKTIKEKSLEKLSEQEIKKYTKYFGYVGVWNTEEPPKPIGVKALGVPSSVVDRIVDLQFNEIGTEELKLIFTGDYDLHDIVQPAGAAGAGSLIDIKSKVVRNILNQQIWAKDQSRNTAAQNFSENQQFYIDPTVKIPNINVPQIDPKVWTEKETWENPYALIRHGAHRDYWTYAVQKRETFVFAVMKMDNNLAAFVGEDAYILETFNDVQSFYNKYNIPRPATWDKSLSQLWLEYGKVIYKIWSENPNNKNKEKMWIAFLNRTQINSNPESLVTIDSKWFTTNIGIKDQQKTKSLISSNSNDISTEIAAINKDYEELQKLKK